MHVELKTGQPNNMRWMEAGFPFSKNELDGYEARRALGLFDTSDEGQVRLVKDKMGEPVTFAELREAQSR